MKTKLCWIPFIPITLLMIFLKYMETTLSQDATFIGLDIVGIRYTVIALAPVLLILCGLISLFDKKTSPFYTVSKNIGAALFSFVAAVAIMFKSVMSIMNIVSSGDIVIIELVTSIVGIVAGIAILFMATCHLSGKNYTSNLGVLMLFPALWSAFELIIVFLSYTTVSVLSKDMLDLVCFALMALFLFTAAMILGSMEGKNPVKRCFIFGMPAVAVTFAYAVYHVVSYINNEAYDLNDIANTVAIFAIGAYALCFLIELTIKANKKDDVVLINEKEDVDEYEQLTIREEVDYLIGENSEENEIEKNEPIIPAETKQEDYSSEFINKEENVTEISQEIEETNPEEIKPVNIHTEETEIDKILEEKHTEPEKTALKEEKKKISDLDFVIAPEEENKKTNLKDELDARMDEIDKLILEIQAKQGKND